MACLDVLAGRSTHGARGKVEVPADSGLDTLFSEPAMRMRNQAIDFVEEARNIIARVGCGGASL